jgi:hypothetical protein
MELWGHTYWPWFILAVVLAFGGPEIYALCTNHLNTLSDYSWAELHVGRSYPPLHTFAWFASLITWGLFVVVITGHIWWRTIS